MEIFYHNSKKNTKKIWLFQKIFISLQQQLGKLKKKAEKIEFFKNKTYL